MTPIKILLWSCVFQIVVMSPAKADSPPETPALKTVYSQNHRFGATSDPALNKTTIFSVGPAGQQQSLWSIPGWYRVAALTDDGIDLVTGYDGVNLAPLTHPQDIIILSFYERARRIRQVRLKDILKPTEELRRTASHFLWGYYTGFDDQGRYGLELVSGRKLAFNPRTGQAVDETRTPR